MLLFYNSTPFNQGSSISSLDLFTGTGSQTTFALVNKEGVDVGSTIQADSTQYLSWLGGFTVVGNSVILSSPPAANAQIVVPGTNSLIASAFDTDSVPGVDNPRVDEVQFFIADVTDIGTDRYDPLPGASGIQISLVDNVSAVGPTTAWVQLASSDPVTGLALTYQATGTTLSTANISYFSTLSASGAAGASSIVVSEASGFRNVVGDYLILNIGASTQEVVRMSVVTGNTLTISGLNYNHFAGETVFDCGRSFWAKLTVPENATGGTAQNYYDIGIRRVCQRSQRT